MPAGLKWNIFIHLLFNFKYQSVASDQWGIDKLQAVKWCVIIPNITSDDVRLNFIDHFMGSHKYLHHLHIVSTKVFCFLIN